MTNPRISRRECFGGLLVAAAQPERSVRLTNDAVDFQLAIRDGKIVSRMLSNKLSNETARLPGSDFELEFEGGGTVAAPAFRATIRKATTAEIEILYEGASGLFVRVVYELPAGRPYLRKRIAVRRAGGPEARLLRADLENWTGVRRAWRSIGDRDRLPCASQPIYCDTLWAGVEFVAAFNEYGTGGFVLRSRPGGPRIGPQWLALNSTVIGCSGPNQVREAFLRYIEDVRLGPPRLVACYNTWWTYYAKDIGGESYKALVRGLKEKLRDRHGLFFDIVVTDEGWADKYSIWQIDRKKLPRGFDEIRAVVEETGAKLGLWISPSAVYPNSTDCDWAKSQGYTAVEYDYRPPARHPGLSLADPKYRSEMIHALQQLIRENNLGHVKYDGLIARESRPHHDLLAGDDSVEPLARHSFELIAASKQANPSLVSEPTYLNSHSNYISPWIIRHADFVWANAGGDCPKGIGIPAPDYRESHTTSREYFIFSSLDEVWLPQNAVQHFDIVHCDDDPGFANHAAMAYGRGRFFVSTYVNPKYLSDDDWRICAGLLGWARKNQAILRNTHITTSRVELGEPYVYSHWLGTRGILVVRNPSNDTVNFTLDLGRERAPRELRDAVCYVQYPYRRGVAAGLSADSTVALVLAPWELLFLEIVPRAELREPVALGARWVRGPNGSMRIAPDAGVDSVRLLLAAGGEQTVPATSPDAAKLTGEVTSYAERRLPETEWLKRNDKPAATRGFELECSVSIPDGAAGKVLLLLQFPGREYHPNSCRAAVNGRPVDLRQSSSESRIGFWVGAGSKWREALPHQSNWHWYIAEAGPGASAVKFTGACAAPECRVGLWAWSERDIAAGAKDVAIECPEPQLPPYRELLERRGICLRRPA
jgi:hypothetical protein